MKKIMFNDRNGLMGAVLNGTKTMTRRIIPLTDADRQYLDTAFDFDFREMVIIDRYSRFEVGEEIAIAQPYKVTAQQNRKWLDLQLEANGQYIGELMDSGGWENKMFVSAYYCPNHIHIKSIKVERLQDITEQDCICEGIKIKKGNRNGERPFGEFTFDGWDDYSFTASEAFAALIDRISGRGTWQSNPYVFAYSFELIR